MEPKLYMSAPHYTEPARTSSVWCYMVPTSDGPTKTLKARFARLHIAWCRICTSRRHVAWRWHVQFRRHAMWRRPQVSDSKLVLPKGQMCLKSLKRAKFVKKNTIIFFLNTLQRQALIYTRIHSSLWMHAHSISMSTSEKLNRHIILRLANLLDTHS